MKRMVLIIFSVVIIVLLFFGIKSLFNEKREREKEEKTEQKKEINEENQSNNSSETERKHKKEKTSRLFQFDSSRQFPVYLKAGWKTYPKGGKIKIITPYGSILYDEPGIDKNFGFQPDGEYIFIAEESKTTGVEIYSYW